MTTITNNKHAFILIGISGSGKSTIARNQFNEHEILSADKMRALLNGEIKYTQQLDRAAWDLLFKLVETQINNEVPICLDNLHLNGKERRKLVHHIKQCDKNYQIHYLLSDDSNDLELCLQRNQNRERTLAPEVIKKQYEKWQNLPLPQLAKEATHVHHSTDFTLQREPATTRTEEQVLFLGDVHGEYSKLVTLLANHGYTVEAPTKYHKTAGAPHLCFVGDLVDRGPESLKTTQLVYQLTQQDDATCIRGNHEDNVYRFLFHDNPEETDPTGNYIHRGSNQSRETAQEFTNQLTPQEKETLREWMRNLPYTALIKLPQQEVHVSHAGLQYHKQQKPNTHLLPTRYDKHQVLRGVPNGERTPNNKHRALARVGTLADNYDGPTQVYGHLNPTFIYPELGGPQCPYQEGNTYSLENRAEQIAEREIGHLLL